MKIADATVLLSPGYGLLEQEHWISRWSRQMSTASLITHKDVASPRREDWAGDIVMAVEASAKPVVLVGHSLGVIAIAHAAPFFPPGKVRGAFLVAPSDWEKPGLIPEHDEHDFSPIPRTRLPFATQMVASRNDPFCEFGKAKSLADAWGASLIDAGDAGHINLKSGQGPWPEGLTAFALFMKTL